MVNATYHRRIYPPLPRRQQHVYNALSPEPATFDDIASQFDFEPETVDRALCGLADRGLAECRGEHPDVFWWRVR